MEQRLEKLEQSLSVDTEIRVARNLASPRSPAKVLHDRQHLHHNPSGQHRHMELDLSCSLGAFPAASITTPSDEGDAIHTPSWPDIISRGIVSLHQAKEHLSFFQQHLDRLISHPLGAISDLAALRARSSLLTAAVCTVAAFCSDSEEYAACLSGLQEEVARTLFAQNNTFDDVLALCIGAFWLRSIAGTLHGLGK